MSTFRPSLFYYFFFNDPATTEIYTLSLHDALPISHRTSPTLDENGSSLDWACDKNCPMGGYAGMPRQAPCSSRSEEHTSELQSRENLVCRLLLEKKKKKKQRIIQYNT